MELNKQFLMTDSRLKTRIVSASQSERSRDAVISCSNRVPGDFPAFPLFWPAESLPGSAVVRIHLKLYSIKRGYKVKAGICEQYFFNACGFPCFAIIKLEKGNILYNNRV